MVSSKNTSKCGIRIMEFSTGDKPKACAAFFFFLFVCLFTTNTTHSLTLNYVEPFCHLQQYVAQLSCRYSELRLLNGADLTGISGGLFTYFCQAASNGPSLK